MYGLEKSARGPFEFDLEKEITSDSQKRENILDNADASTKNLKTALREGKESKDFDTCGLLLHGYSALKDVIENIDLKEKA